MVFYKGGVQHNQKETMPIPEILNLKNSAEKINKALNKQHNKTSKK
jgi:hypothetical protein